MAKIPLLCISLVDLLRQSSCALKKSSPALSVFFKFFTIFTADSAFPLDWL